MAKTSKSRVKARAGAGVKPQPKRRSSTRAFEETVRRPAAEQPSYVLRLYVAGTTPRSTQAIETVRMVCAEHLAGRCDLRVIDIYQQPEAAVANQILAAPTLVKEMPLPVRRTVGDFSNRARLLACLDLAPASPQP